MLSNFKHVETKIIYKTMQQLSGPLSLLNQLILQQVAAYGNYSQVYKIIMKFCL